MGDHRGSGIASAGDIDPLERVIADACLGERAGSALVGDLRGFLESRGVATDDVDAILAAPQHLAVYRSLVRNGLERVIVRMLPRTRARLNAACAGRFDADVAGFLEEVAPRTHYLRDVPGELFSWAEPRWRRDGAIPAYIVDLASHELACFALAAADGRNEAAPLVEIALDRPVAFSGSTRRVRYQWAVHELPSGSDATDPPPRRDVRLLAYRDDEYAVRWLELTPLAATIVDRLMDGQPFGVAVAQSCADHETAPAAVTADVAALLADLGERGVVLGARRI